MPYIKRPNGDLIFYDVTGKGTPIITTHGFIENGSYWGRTGISAALADAGYCVVDMDLRGHGRSIPNINSPDFSIGSLVEDINAVADANGFEKFHLLTHATGGIISSYYIRKYWPRLLSMMASDTSPCTNAVSSFLAPEWDGKEIPAQDPVPYPEGFLRSAWMFGENDFTQLIDACRADVKNHWLGAFLNSFVDHPREEECWRIVKEVFNCNNLDYCKLFCDNFDFDDSDPRTLELQKIGCPVLLMVGELDYSIVPGMECLSRNIPGAEYHVFKNSGHMTTMDNPELTIKTILDFLSRLAV